MKGFIAHFPPFYNTNINVIYCFWSFYMEQIILDPQSYKWLMALGNISSTEYYIEIYHSQ